MPGDPLQLFAQIGRQVEARWRATNYDEVGFPELATAVLAEAQPGRTVSADDLLQWLLVTDVLPQQVDPSSKFGQPPITIYRGARFFIDALFWLDGTTEIHQHGFSGAFHVLSGGSVHTDYRWQLEDRISAALLFGRLELAGSELLRPGDTRPIRSGAGLIHGLFHLDRPSVSIVVRTYQDTECGPQYRYHPPSLAEDPFFDDGLVKRRLEALTVLRTLDPARYETAAAELVATSDFYLAYRIARQHLVAFEDLARTQALLEHGRARHGSRVDRLGPVFAELARISTLQTRREVLTGVDHRFFLALLLNLPTRRAILETIAARYPGTDPIELAAQWTVDLADAVAGGAAGSDHTDVVIGELLRGHQGEALLERLKLDHDADDVDRAASAIQEIEHTLRAAPILKPLFR